LSHIRVISSGHTGATTAESSRSARMSDIF
jgi:hypothetical protein